MRPWPGPAVGSGEPRPDRARSRWGGAGPVPTYLAQAIICTLLFNVVAGVVALVYAVAVRRRLAKGDWDGAARASRLARIWCWVSVGVGALVLALAAMGLISTPFG